jgi:hypothetical protein
VRLAENMAKNPSAVPLVQSMITPGMMDRLEGNEPPLTEQ